jgi:hypothetical protein
MKELKEIVGKHLGYLPKFKSWVDQGYSLENIQSVFNALTTEKIDKNIHEFETPEDVINYVIDKKNTKLTNQCIKCIPSRARKNVTDKLLELIKLNIEHVDDIKSFYSKKGGRYTEPESLYNDTENLIESLSGGWSVDNVFYNIEELVYRDESTLILDVNSYERSEILGSKSWCISFDRYHWNQYVSRFNKQYFIFDFSKSIGDKKSMIGVTLDIEGNITHSHYRDDSECPKEELDMYKMFLRPYPVEYIKENGSIKEFEKLKLWDYIIMYSYRPNLTGRDKYDLMLAFLKMGNDKDFLRIRNSINVKNYAPLIECYIEYFAHNTNDDRSQLYILSEVDKIKNPSKKVKILLIKLYSYIGGMDDEIKQIASSMEIKDLITYSSLFDEYELISGLSFNHLSDEDFKEFIKMTNFNKSFLWFDLAVSKDYNKFKIAINLDNSGVNVDINHISNVTIKCFFDDYKEGGYFLKEVLKSPNFHIKKENNYSKNRDILKNVCKKGYIDLVDLVLNNKNFDVEDNYDYYIKLASDNKHFDISEKLINFKYGTKI